MRTSWRDIKNQTMTREQQARAHALAMRDLAELELRDLREALHITQVTLAKKLKTTQAAVSRLEKRPHMLVNTLRDYVEALGGRIEVRAVLPDRTVSLTHFLRKKKTAAMEAGRESTTRKARAIAEGVAGAAMVVYVFYFVLSWNQPTGSESTESGLVGGLFARLFMPPWIYAHGLSVFFTSASRPTFLLGHSYPGGVWFYFPVLFVLKSPVGFLCLLVLTLTVTLIKGSQSAGSDAVVISSAVGTHWRVIWVSLVVFTGACLASPLDISFRHFSVPIVLSILTSSSVARAAPKSESICSTLRASRSGDHRSAGSKLYSVRYLGLPVLHSVYKCLWRGKTNLHALQ